MKKIFISVLVLAIFGLIVFFALEIYEPNINDSNTVTPTVSTSNDVKNISYILGGEVFTLVNGVASKEIAPGSATKNTLSIFGEPVYGDLNGDGKNDAAIMLVNNPGGSGSFYYAVLAIATGSTYVSTNALLLGDRIAPQTVEIQDGHALYNYAERKAGEPMTVQPSLGKSLWINYDLKTGTIGELVKNFEGEADTNKMTLSMKKWDWVKTQLNDGAITTPKKTGVFTLTFKNDGSVSITTDCNVMGGSYVVKGNKLTFDKMISTMMYCEGSQEQEFSKEINNIGSYLFTSKGELVLEIKNDSGTMTFR